MIATAIGWFAWPAAISICALSLPDGDSSPAAKRQRDQQALQSYADWIGDWRGVGQPRRGSARDNWREETSWIWRLSPDSAALSAEFKDGKYLKSLKLQPGSNSGEIQAIAVLANGQERRYSGKPSAKNVLALASTDAKDDEPARLTLSFLHGTRFLILLEKRNPRASSEFDRIAEVGYTRQGVSFATSGDGYPVCIVTGGRGTTQVSYKGKTYWVCCSGCKDLFDEDPEAVLAEAAERVKAKGKAQVKADTKNKF